MNIGRGGGRDRCGIKSDLIDIFAFAMKFAIEAAIRDTVYAFPTSTVDINSMVCKRVPSVRSEFCFRSSRIRRGAITRLDTGRIRAHFHR